MALIIALIATMAVVITLCWLWLWFMIARREKWESIVDRENAFWVKLGVSASLAGKIKRLEKGLYEKVLVGAAAVFGTLSLAALCVWMIVRR